MSKKILLTLTALAGLAQAEVLSLTQTVDVPFKFQNYAPEELIQKVLPLRRKGFAISTSKAGLLFYDETGKLKRRTDLDADLLRGPYLFGGGRVVVSTGKRKGEDEVEYRLQTLDPSGLVIAKKDVRSMEIFQLPDGQLVNSQLKEPTAQKREWIYVNDLLGETGRTEISNTDEWDVNYVPLADGTILAAGQNNYSVVDVRTRQEIGYHKFPTNFSEHGMLGLSNGLLLIKGFYALKVGGGIEKTLYHEPGANDAWAGNYSFEVHGRIFLPFQNGDFYVLDTSLNREAVLQYSLVPGQKLSLMAPPLRLQDGKIALQFEGDVPYSKVKQARLLILDPRALEFSSTLELEPYEQSFCGRAGPAAPFEQEDGTIVMLSCGGRLHFVKRAE